MSSHYNRDCNVLKPPPLPQCPECHWTTAIGPQRCEIITISTLPDMLQSTRGRSCLLLLVNGCTNLYFVVLSAFWITTLSKKCLRTLQASQRLFQPPYSSVHTEWLERMSHLGPVAVCSSLHLPGCYDPPMCSPMLHTDVPAIHFPTGWGHAKWCDDYRWLSKKYTFRRWQIDESVRSPIGLS